jgi:hypothetical protein
MSQPITLIILGYGGIGSNISLLTECDLYRNNEDVKFCHPVPIDDDTVEFSNLNRSNFRFKDIGNDKAPVKGKATTFEDLMKILFKVAKRDEEYISFRHYELEAMFRNMKTPEEMTPDAFRDFKIRHHLYVIDCRDTFDPEAIFDGIDFKLTYNGAFTIRIEYNPVLFKDAIFNYNPEIRYQTMPSFVTPPLYIIERLYQLIRFIERKGVDSSSGYEEFRSDKDMHFQEHINLRLTLEQMSELPTKAEEKDEEPPVEVEAPETDDDSEGPEEDD